MSIYHKMCVKLQYAEICDGTFAVPKKHLNYLTSINQLIESFN